MMKVDVEIYKNMQLMSSAAHLVVPGLGWMGGPKGSYQPAHTSRRSRPRSSRQYMLDRVALL